MRISKNQETAPNPLRVTVGRLRARRGVAIISEIVACFKEARRIFGERFLANSRTRYVKKITHRNCLLLSVSAALLGYLNGPESAQALETGNTALAPVGIVLPRGWDQAMSDGVATMKELRELLTGYAQPNLNTAPAPELNIYKGIKYLMPFNEARGLLGLSQEVNSKILVACPGFPFHSLVAYSFHGSFEGGFDTVYIVTDRVLHVVAVEFTKASVEKTNIAAEQQKKHWVTFDFVNTRVKGQADARVRHSTYPEGDTLRIDSVFMNPDSRFLSGTAMHPTRLYLPRPLAELILYRISKSGI